MIGFRRHFSVLRIVVKVISEDKCRVFGKEIRPRKMALAMQKQNLKKDKTVESKHVHIGSTRNGPM